MPGFPGTEARLPASGDERETDPSVPLSIGLSLQAKQHAEKAKEILANSIESPCHNKTDIFKCSLELFYTLGRALLSLQKYPFPLVTSRMH
jgi:hypothetical protein